MRYYYPPRVGSGMNDRVTYGPSNRARAKVRKISRFAEGFAFPSSSSPSPPPPFPSSTSSRCSKTSTTSYDFRNELTVPFELRRAVVSPKLQLHLQLQHPSRAGLPQASPPVSPAIAARRFLPPLGRSLNLRRLRLLKSREVRRVSPSRRYTRGTQIVTYARWLQRRLLVYRALAVGAFRRFDVPDEGI